MVCVQIFKHEVLHHLALVVPGVVVYAGILGLLRAVRRSSDRLVGHVLARTEISWSPRHSQLSLCFSVTLFENWVMAEQRFLTAVRFCEERQPVMHQRAGMFTDVQVLPPRHTRSVMRTTSWSSRSHVDFASPTCYLSRKLVPSIACSTTCLRPKNPPRTNLLEVLSFCWLWCFSCDATPRIFPSVEIVFMHRSPARKLLFHMSGAPRIAHRSTFTLCGYAKLLVYEAHLLGKSNAGYIVVVATTGEYGRSDHVIEA